MRRPHLDVDARSTRRIAFGGSARLAGTPAMELAVDRRPRLTAHETRMIWYVAFGSAVGGAARFWLAGYLQRTVGGTFPFGTLVVNISGSFLLGFLLRFALDTPAIGPELRLALTTGFCGGYTTFSTFSYETIALVESGDWRRASVYVGLSVVASLVGAFAGIALARELVALRGAR